MNRAALLRLVLPAVLLWPAAALAADEDVEQEVARKLAEALGEPVPEQEPEPVVSFGTVVSARRFKETVFESVRAVDRFGPFELGRQAAANMPEALREMPGVMVQQTNRGGGAPYIRGMIGPQVLVLVDGVRLNNSTWRTGPLQYLNTVDPWTVEHLEVVRGPGSVLYGSDALGGVVQLFTSDPPRPGAGQWMARPAGGFRWSTADQGLSSRISLAAGYDNYAVVGGASFKRFGDLRAGGEGGVQPFSGYREWDADVKLKLKPASWITITGAHQTVRIGEAGRFDHPDEPPDSRKATFYDNDRDLTYLTASGRLSCIDTEYRLTLSHQQTEEVQVSRRVPGDDLRFAGLPDDRWDRVRTVGLSASGTSRMLQRTLGLTYGLEYYRDWVDSDKNFSDESGYDLLGVFLLLEYTLQELGPGELRLFVGDRFSWFAAHAPDVEQIGEVDIANVGNVNSAGVQYLLWDALNLRFTWSQGFRAPNLQETTQVGDTGEFFEIPNEDLGPERSDTLELGVRARWRFIGISAAYYFSFVSDVIVREDAVWKGATEIDGKLVRRRVNADEAQIQGVELGLRLSPLRFLHVTASGTWTEGNVIDEGHVSPARRIPPFFGRIGLRFEEPDLGVFAGAQLAGAAAQRRLSSGDIKDSRIGTEGTDGWWTLNLRAGYAFNERNRLVLNLENLLDRRYKTHGSGLLASGFNASLLLQLGY